MTIVASPKHEWSQERIFFSAMAVAMAAVVFIGFARTFFLTFLFEPDPYAPPEMIFYVHGVFFAAWMVLLIVQPTLIRTGRVEQHRRLGRLGAVLATVMVVIGIWSSLVAAGRPDGFIGVSAPPLEFLALIVFNLIMFGLLVGLAIVLRRKGPYHKRLMLLATVNLLQAAVVRIPFEFIANGGPLVSFLLPDIFIVLLVIWDLGVLRRIHPATLWGGLAIVASLPLRLWISDTQPWLAVADFAVDLVS